jgi:hypothetical protein
MNKTMDNTANFLIENGLFYFTIYILVSIALFFIIREIVLWYFRINKNTESLSRIADSLEKISIAAEFFTTDLVEKHNSRVVAKKMEDSVKIKKTSIPKEENMTISQ